MVFYKQITETETAESLLPFLRYLLSDPALQFSYKKTEKVARSNAGHFQQPMFQGGVLPL